MDNATRSSTRTGISPTIPRYLLAVAGAALAVAGHPTAARAATSTLPAGHALTEADRNADAKLFALFFEGCDPTKLRTMLTDDLEFYHDKDGVVATSAPPFIAGYAKNCEARKQSDAWRS